jgi:glycosyltransferase involved in cell wall biosynthesis
MSISDPSDTDLDAISNGTRREWFGTPVRVSVVIPALNEARNLPLVLPRIPDWVDEVVLVDGNSTDGTLDVALQLRPSVRTVKQQGHGKGVALRTGFAAATGDVVVMLDADASMDPGEIDRFVQVLLAGADFAKGSRFLPGGGTADMPLYRKLGNWGFVGLVRLLFGGRYSDLCYGYNAFWAQALPLLNLCGDGFEIETIMNIRVLRAGLKVVEVPSFEAKRVYGTGRLRTIPDGWRVLRAIVREWLADQRVSRPQVATPGYVGVPDPVASLSGTTSHGYFGTTREGDATALDGEVNVAPVGS